MESLSNGGGDAGRPASQQLSKHGIGASEAAAVMGLNPYVGPIGVWERKVAELAGAPRVELPENDAIRWGILLEQPIRQAYCERFQVEVGVPPTSMFREDAPWRRATPDGFVLDADQEPTHGLEIKTASLRMVDKWGPDGSDEVPDHYLIQCAWSMHVTGLPRWDLAALIGGQDFRCYQLDRDYGLEMTVVKEVDRFWHENVLAKVPPPVDATEECTQYLVRRWSVLNGDLVAATPEIDRLLTTIRLARAVEKDEAERLRLLENQLRAFVADHDGVMSMQHGRITCRPQLGRAMTDWESIARFLAEVNLVPTERLAALIDEHTKRARGSRPLRFPRAWGAQD